MSLVRSRSVSRQRVVKLTEAFGSGEALDPYIFLEELLPHIKDLDVPLSVKLTDGENDVIFLLSNFLSKEYEVVGDLVKFGFKRLKLRSLKANISFDVNVSFEGA